MIKAWGEGRGGGGGEGRWGRGGEVGAGPPSASITIHKFGNYSVYGQEIQVYSVTSNQITCLVCICSKTGHAVTSNIMLYCECGN